MSRHYPKETVPVCCIEGNADQQKSYDLVESYYKDLKAPKKTYSDSVNTVFHSEPPQLQQLMIEKTLSARL